MKAVLYTDAKRTKTFGEYSEETLTFNDDMTKVSINDHKPKRVNREFTKTVGRTEIRLWSTKLWGEKVYFRQTVLVK